MSFTRTILTYGAISGIVLVLLFGATLFASLHEGSWGMAVGFLTMFAALSFVFVGVKRYRDETLGGVIRFGPAFVLGLGIALVAAVFYVIGWEAYMYATDYTFMAEMTEHYLEQQAAAGASAEQLAAARAEMDAFARSYANPLYRMGITLTEISPVVLIVPLISAALLRNPRFLPAHGATPRAA